MLSLAVNASQISMIADVQHGAYGVARYAGQRMSKEDFLHWESDDNYIYEFNEGVLEPTTSMRQDEITLLKQLTRRFSQTAQYQQGGELIAEVDVWLTDKQMRRPDIAYYSADQQRQMADGSRVVPAFVIEFGSVTDTESVSVQKRHEYFDAGVQVVWWVFPLYKEVVIYRSPIDMTGRHDDDLLSAAPALPDFQLTVAELFG